MNGTQTADQVNLPQTGKVELPPQVTAPNAATAQAQAVRVARAQLPAKVVAKQFAEAQAKPTGGKPKGWWAVRKFEGTLAGVVKAVQDATDIPAHWKAAMIADMQAQCGTEHNFVYLDAQFCVHAGNATLHYTCQPDKKLL